MKQNNLQTELEKTRAAVAQIVCWCTVVALHQKYGIGGQRLERLAEQLDIIQSQYVREVEMHGGSYAMQTMQNNVAAYCDPVMRVPLNRAPRSRREKQLRMVGDEAATIAWCNFARAAHENLGFGKQRLDIVKQETLENYRQFSEWEREDPDWAMENLRKCVSAALGEEVRVVDWNEAHADKAERDRVTDIQAIKTAVVIAQEMGRNRPAGLAVENNAVKVQQAIDLCEQVKMDWRRM